MKLYGALIAAVLLLAVAVAIATRSATAADQVQVDLAEWTSPQIGKVGDDPFGKLVRYGYALIVDTRT